MDLLVSVVGWIGAALLVTAYGLVSSGRLTGRGAPFQTLNVLGAVALTLNSGWHDAWPSAALNVVWVFLGIGALIRRPNREQPATAS